VSYAGVTASAVAMPVAGNLAGYLSDPTPHWTSVVLLVCVPNLDETDINVILRFTRDAQSPTLRGRYNMYVTCIDSVLALRI